MSRSTSSADRTSLGKAAQQEIEKLKGKLTVSRKWSERWKATCCKYRVSNAQIILDSTNALDEIDDDVTALDELFRRMAGKISRKSGPTKSDLEADVLIALNGLQSIKDTVEMALANHASEFNIDLDEDPEPPHSEEKVTPLRLVPSRTKR